MNIANKPEDFPKSNHYVILVMERGQKVFTETDFDGERFGRGPSTSTILDYNDFKYYWTLDEKEWEAKIMEFNASPKLSRLIKAFHVDSVPTIKTKVIVEMS